MKSIHWVTTSIFKGQEGREEEEEGRRRGQRESYSTGGGGNGNFFSSQCCTDDPETALSNGKTIQAKNITFSSNHIF